MGKRISAKQQAQLDIKQYLKEEREKESAETIMPYKRKPKGNKLKWEYELEMVQEEIKDLKDQGYNLDELDYE